MKLKKILSVILSAAIALTCALSACITSYAVEPSSFVRFTSGGATLVDILRNMAISGNTTLRYTIDLTTGSDQSPTVLTYDDLMALRNCTYNYVGSSYNVTVEFTVTTDTTTYTCVISSSELYSFNAAEQAEWSAKWDRIKALGGISFALKVEPSPVNEKITMQNYAIQQITGDIGIKLNYRITNSELQPLLAAANIAGKENLSLLNVKGDDIKKLEFNPQNVLNFTIDDSNRSGVYIANIPKEILDNYIKKTEAYELVKEKLMTFIGLTEEEYNSESFKNLRDYINKKAEALQAQIDALSGTNYVTEEALNGLVKNYLETDEVKEGLVNAILPDLKIDEKVQAEINKIVGAEVDADTKTALQEYLAEQVKGQLFTQVSNYQTPTNLIISAVSASLEKLLADETNDIRNKMVTAIIDGLKIDKDFVDSLKVTGPQGPVGPQGPQGEQGQQGEQGIQGVPGESFAEWAVRNYGSIENFINSVGFEGWAKNKYGSVDNFIKAVSNSGKSAYDLAVEAGYKGSLTEWLDSLKGEDGKSAYEIAVENGFDGDEEEWLESLEGEDGKSAYEIAVENGFEGSEEEWLDSLSGEIVYVNGSYEDIPTSGNDTDDEEGPDPDDDSSDEATLDDDTKPSYNPGNSTSTNPATGAAIGIILPIAAVGSVLLVKKGKRRRGRR